MFFSSQSELIDIVSPLDVCRYATELSQDVHYDVELISAREPVVLLANGVQLTSHRCLPDISPDELPHTVVVAGGAIDVTTGSEGAAFAAWLRPRATKIPRIASVCTGAFTLAYAGLLRGEKATTHWVALDRLAERYPDTEVIDDSIFVRSGHIVTAAGMSAGFDMMLAMIAEDHGHENATAVARHLVLFVQRPGGQRQFSRSLRSQASRSAPIRKLQTYILENLAGDLSITALAGEVHMSGRNLTRVFKRETGIGPGAFVRDVRLDHAKRLLEEALLNVSEIAEQVGAKDTTTLNRWFIRYVGVSPTHYRKHFGRHDRSVAETSGQA